MNQSIAVPTMIITPRSNEYEQREAKNFILLDSSKDEFIRSKRLPPKSHSLSKSVSEKSGPRLRSASTGRDKRSEFQARYWAFLFGNLQRAVDEIYKTVEYYEHLASCQEAILVLENYIREFKALAEFFKMSWDYEKTPLPQRPQSLAWEVRKTNAVPRVRNKNINSPSMSGKSSPSSYSGSNSPCPTIEENKKVERIKSPPKIDATLTHVTEDSILAAKERKFEELLKDVQPLDQQLYQKTRSLSLENLNQVCDSNPDEFQFYPVIQMRDGETQTEGIHDDNLTLYEYIQKYCMPKTVSIPSESTEPVETENMNEETETINCPQLAPSTPSLSDVLKPSEINEVEAQPISKPIRAPVRANYSLRNQTITSRNSRVSVESTARKSAATSHTTARASRPLPRSSAGGKNIPTAAPTVSQRDSGQQKYPNSVPVRSKTMIEIPKQQQRFSLRSGELRKKKSLEDNTTDSSTSTLKASTEKLGSKNSLNRGSGDIKKGVAKKVDSKPNVGSGDGWMTVKNKRRSSWSSQRFDQPSASASLPTLLALLNENGEESEKEQSSTTKLPAKSENAKPKNVPSKATASKTADSKVKPKSATASKSEPVVASLPPRKKLTSSVKAKVNSNAPSSKRVTVKEKPLVQPVSKQNQQNFIKRQKSDITGLNLKSLHREYLREHREKNGAVKKQRENEEEKKVDMNLQTSTLLISQTIDNLYSELGGKKSKFTNGSLSSCDELEDDMESDDDHQKKLVEEQESLERQIRELENSEIDVDTETDETDCEAILCDLEDNESSENNDRKSPTTFINEDMTLEMRYAPMLADLSQMERAETLATLQELVARDPGRAQKLHLKLSSPSRRRSFHETLRKYQAKQTRAQEKRSELQQLKSQKIQQLIQRVEQVKAAKFEITESRRIRMEEKLQRATENRENYLKNKIKKAHDEEEKMKEIAFIKNIEMQNKRLDLLESCKEQEGRLQDIELERQKRQTEKLAKEADVVRRRQEIEMERKKKLERMDETRREREQRVGKIQEEKEKARQELAKEKQRDRDKRLQAIQQQQLQDTEDLQRKIAQKQQEYQKRHEENIEHIRQRAFELAQQRNPDDVKSLNDEDENLEIAERTRESIKLSKKKMKRIKERDGVLSQKYLEELPELATSHRKQSQVPKLLTAIRKGNAGTGVQMGAERPIGQIIRIIEKSSIVDFHALWLLDGLGTLGTVIEMGLQPNSDVSRVAVTKAVQLYRNACSSCKQIAQHSILGGSFIVLLDALNFTMKNPDTEVKNPSCPVEASTEILLALTVVLSNLKQSENPALGLRLHDIVSYLIASGILEQITKKCLMVREPIENQQSLLLPLLAMIGFVTKITEISTRESFMSIVTATEVFGTITLLYKTMSLGETIPPRTVSLAGSTYGLIKAIAMLDTINFQKILDEERLTFKFLDVVTILLNFCGPKLAESDSKEMKAVIRDLIVIIGYFCANNRRNQNLLTSEQSYIILKSITKLPIDLAPTYYPTLLTIIWENPEAEAILGRDFDIQMLKEYEKSALAKKNPLLHMLEI